MSQQVIHLLYGALAPWLALSLLVLGRNPRLSRTRITGSLLVAFFLLRRCRPQIASARFAILEFLGGLLGARLFRWWDLVVKPSQQGSCFCWLSSSF